MEQPLFKVNERSTGDRWYSRGLPDIVELFDGSEKILKEANAEKKQKLELEASQAEELGLSSLETFGQTKAGKGEESSREEPKKPPSSNDMIGFLREKSAQENEFRQQELDLKRQEMQNFQTLMTNQQQQTNLLMQQQQLMNIAFLNILGRFLLPQNPPN